MRESVTCSEVTLAIRMRGSDTRGKCKQGAFMREVPSHQVLLAKRWKKQLKQMPH
jgi:hypothetical protein